MSSRKNKGLERASKGKHAKGANFAEATSVNKQPKRADQEAPVEEGADLRFDNSDGESDFFAKKPEASVKAGVSSDKGQKGSEDRPEGATMILKAVPAVAEPAKGASVTDGAIGGALSVSGDKGVKAQSKTKKNIAIGIGALIALLFIVYIAGVAFFADRLYPNTKLGSSDVSMQTSADLRKTLNDRVNGYVLTISGQDGFSQKLVASEIGLTVDGSVTLGQMVPERTSLTWPVDVFLSHDISKNVATSYNLAVVQSGLDASIAKYNESATMPANATIAFNIEKQVYEVMPEQLGTALDPAAVSAKVAAAITSLTEEVKLTDEDLLKPTILSTDPRMGDAITQAEKMGKADVTYRIGDVEVARVFPDLVSTWITLDKDCKATLNDELLKSWATETAEPLNTVGSERAYERPDGKVVTVSGGSYGWEVDMDAFVAQVKADVAEGATKTSDIPCSMVGEGFTKVGGADWGLRYVDVDLSEQYARFYGDNGAIIWECDFISGEPTPDKATPTGVYYIRSKESPSKLIGYLPNGQKDYETTVKFWMPFIKNAIGFHDATWQPGFGGQMYRQGYGSHGCINLSYSDAQDLYSLIKLNDVVVVHN